MGAPSCKWGVNDCQLLLVQDLARQSLHTRQQGRVCVMLHCALYHLHVPRSIMDDWLMLPSYISAFISTHPFIVLAAFIRASALLCTVPSVPVLLRLVSANLLYIRTAHVMAGLTWLFEHILETFVLFTPFWHYIEGLLQLNLAVVVAICY